MDLRKLKDKASEAFSKGKFAKAAELYVDYCKAEPKDLQARLRMGDAFAKSGEKAQAINAYRSAAEGFAREGFLPRAIAASKLILELDPAHQSIQQMLADLYAKKSGQARPSRPAPPPPPPRGEVAPPAAVSERASPGVVALELSKEGVAPLDLSHELPPELSLARPEAPAAPVEIELSVEEPSEVEEVTQDAVVSRAPAAATAPSGTGADGAPEAPALASPDRSGPLPSEPAVASGGAPPGLRRRSADEVILLERPKTPLPPASPSRIWIPPGFTAPPTPSQAMLPKLDEGELDLSRASPLSTPLDSAPTRAPTFTELELDSDSLLHAVEEAARAGLGPQAPGSAAELDEPFSIGDELVDEPDAGGLPRIPLFSDLPPDAFIELFERCPLRRPAQGERVIHQGSSGDSFFVICEGQVNVFREEEEGGRKELATLSDGAFFGEMALLSDAPRMASVEAASEDTQLLELSATTLTELSQRFPQVASALRKFCRQRLLSNVMRSSALFRVFNSKERRSLVERFRAREVQRADTILREGAESDGLYVVLSGEVEVRKADQVLARLKEGELFGEMSLLQKTPATATVSASRRTSLLRLPREDFDQLVLSHPQILALVAELSDDRRKQNEAVLGGAAVVGEEGLLLV